MASKAGNAKSGGKKSAESGRNKVASEGIGVLLIAGGILAAAYLFFSATGYLGEVLGKALFGLIGVIAYALPVILIATAIAMLTIPETAGKPHEQIAAESGVKH